MTRVVVVTTSFPLHPRSISGLFVKRLIEHLPPDVSATVVTPCGRERKREDLGTHERVRCFRYAPRRLQTLAHEPGGVPAALASSRWKYLLLPPFLLAFFIATQRHGRVSDILHANWSLGGVIAGAAARLLGRPAVTTLRGSDVNLAHRSPLHRALLAVCLRLNHRIVTVSEGMARDLGSWFPRQHAKISFIPNGIDERLLNVTRSPLATATRTLTAIGNLVPAKGFDTLIDACALLKADRAGFFLRVIGDGPDATRLRRRVEQHGLLEHVAFAGTQPPECIATTLSNTTIFVHPSRAEGRPNALLEAMACGTPIIAADIPGVNELIVNGSTGLLFVPGDAVGLAKCIGDLLEHPGRAAQFGANARQIIRDNRLFWHEIGKRYAELYRDVLRNAGVQR